MIVTAWNNGAHNRNGSGYGFLVSTADRDTFFKQEWDSITLEIEGEPGSIEIDIDKAAFWSEAGNELISAGIGKWLRKFGLAPWHRGNPPTFILEPAEGNHFTVHRTAKKPAPGR